MEKKALRQELKKRRQGSKEQGGEGSGPHLIGVKVRGSLVSLTGPSLHDRSGEQRSLEEVNVHSN